MIAAAGIERGIAPDENINKNVEEIMEWRQRDQDTNQQNSAAPPHHKNEY